MLLSEKMNIFLSGRKLECANNFDRTDVNKVHHRSRGNGGGYYFEESSSLNGNWVINHENEEKGGFFGSHSYMNDGGYIRGRVFVGRYCSIGRRVTIGAGTHAISGLSSSPRIMGVSSRPYLTEEMEAIRTTKLRSQYTVVSSDVWIGDGVVVMPGVTIGEGAVIGANSVVTKNVQPHQIVAGIPARVIGRRFSEELSERILATYWWEYPHEEINSFPTNNVFEFLERVQDLRDRKVVPKDTYFLDGKRQKAPNNKVGAVAKAKRWVRDMLSMG